MDDYLKDLIRAALEGDSNDAEHDALVAVAEALRIDWTPAESERHLTDDEAAKLTELAAAAVRANGIDDDDIDSGTIGDHLHGGVFSEALVLFDAVPAAELSDVIHEAISATYWQMVDEANGIDTEPSPDPNWMNP